MGCAVTGIRPGRGRLHVVHAQGEVGTRAAVFCAGAWADRLAVAAGGGADPGSCRSGVDTCACDPSAVASCDR
jgi:glycine/D-amino acid oxidase-like deaminating enzyme